MKSSRIDSYATARSSRFPRAFLAGALLSAAWLAGGCTAVEPDVSEKSPRADDAGVLVLLGDSTPDSVVGAVAARFDILSGADLGLSHAAPSAEEARVILAGARGIAVDLSQADDADMLSWMPVFDAALELGVPLILEGASDADRVAQAIGFGMEADLLLITGAGAERTVDVLDPADDAQVDVEGEALPLRELYQRLDRDHLRAVARKHGIALAELDRSVAAYRDAPLDLRPFKAMDGGMDTGAMPDLLTERLLSHEPAPVQKSLPNGSTYRYHVNFSTAEWVVLSIPFLDPVTLTWTTLPLQTATLNMDFTIDLVADGLFDEKYAVVRSAGSGVNPGTLFTDGDESRGYFQESLDVWITPKSGPLHLFTYQPRTTNRQSSYSSWTGYSATTAVQSDGIVTATLGYSEQNVNTQTLSDFGVTDQSIGDVNHWRWELTSVEGNAYYDYEDLVEMGIEGCGLYHLPPLAKSTLNPELETIFRVEGDYDGTAKLELKYKLGVRHVTADEEDLFWCEYGYHWKGYTRWATYTIDFSRVSAP